MTTTSYMPPTERASRWKKGRHSGQPENWSDRQLRQNTRHLGRPPHQKPQIRKRSRGTLSRGAPRERIGKPSTTNPVTGYQRMPRLPASQPKNERNTGGVTTTVGVAAEAAIRLTNVSPGVQKREPPYPRHRGRSPQYTKKKKGKGRRNPKHQPRSNNRRS